MSVLLNSGIPCIVVDKHESSFVNLMNFVVISHLTDVRDLAVHVAEHESMVCL